MKLHRAAILASLLFSASVHAADIQGGESFADGQSVTASRLNNHVNGATIVPGFIANKSSASPVSGDSFLFYQAGSSSLQRTTLSALETALYASPTFGGTSTFNGATVISGVLTPTAIAADQNDYNPTSLSTSTTLRLATDGSGSKNITGLAGGIDGRILILHNVDATYNLTLKAAGPAGATSTGSSAANRFGWTNDYVLHPGEVVVLHYGGTSSLWRRFEKIAQDDVTIAPSLSVLTDGATITWAMDATKVAQNATVTLAGNRQLNMTGLVNGMTGVLEVVQDGTGSRKLALSGPNFTDGVGAGSTTFTSAVAAFVSTDTGGPLNEPGNAHIPAGTTITSVTNGTTVVASASVSSGTGITFYLPRRQSKVSGGGAGAVTLTTTANAVDVLTWIYDGTRILWAPPSKNFN